MARRNYIPIAYHIPPKSLYRSRAGRHFYGTENQIWAAFGPIGNTVGADNEQLLKTVFFHAFRGQKEI